MFRALLLDESGGTVTASIRDLDDSTLPDGNVTVAVEYTTINYKDGLVINGGGGLVKRWPHVPGIDFAGRVVSSSHAEFKAGEEVILNGWGAGETHFGGYAQMARVKGDWLVQKPAQFRSRCPSPAGTSSPSCQMGTSIYIKLPMKPCWMTWSRETARCSPTR